MPDDTSGRVVPTTDRVWRSCGNGVVRESSLLSRLVRAVPEEMCGATHKRQIVWGDPYVSQLCSGRVDPSDASTSVGSENYPRSLCRAILYLLSRTDS
jgi:hypothetical protein